MIDGFQSAVVETVGVPGTISFPIYILHGPIGQVFYKRVVAETLRHSLHEVPQFFPVYLLIVLVSAAVVHEIFIKNKGARNIESSHREGHGRVCRVITKLKYFLRVRTVSLDV